MKRKVLPDFSAAKGRRLLVALSGGADSTALLCMLAEQRHSLGLTLTAAHIEHGIRGSESLADAQFCVSLCRKLGIDLRVESVDGPARRESGEGLETAARRLRYDALRRIKDETRSEWIALAHHLDDQAETVLMHLLRGCGPDGAGGMEVLSGDLYRPLLSIPKRELEQWLTERSIAWCEDKTNSDPFTPRNALRLYGLPALEKSYPSAAQAIARYAESARCENRLMESLTETFLRKYLDTGPWGTRIRSPEDADEAVLRRAVRRVCGAELSYDKLTEITALCREKRGRTDISSGLFAERTPGAVYFLPKKPPEYTPESLPCEGSIRFGGFGTLTVRPAQPVPVRNDPDCQVLDADALCGAVIRTRRDGDRIRPLGGGEKLLSDYLTDRKIDRPLRDAIPLVASGSRILWAVGVGVSEDAKLRPETRRAVQLQWNSDSMSENNGGNQS